MQLVVDKVGTLEGFSPVYKSEHTKANMLSFADKGFVQDYARA
jgi:hypothetical protein